MQTPTLTEINNFARKVENDMSGDEFENWMALQPWERQAIVWQTWFVIHNSKDAA